MIMKVMMMITVMMMMVMAVEEEKKVAVLTTTYPTNFCRSNLANCNALTNEIYLLTHSKKLSPAYLSTLIPAGYASLIFTYCPSNIEENNKAFNKFLINYPVSFLLLHCCYCQCYGVPRRM